MWGCEDDKMWKWEMWRWDVKMIRFEDEQMWRCEDVKMRKQRRFEDVKMWHHSAQPNFVTLVSSHQMGRIPPQCLQNGSGTGTMIVRFPQPCFRQHSDFCTRIQKGLPHKFCVLLRTTVCKPKFYLQNGLVPKFSLLFFSRERLSEKVLLIAVVCQPFSHLLIFTSHL